VRHTRLQLQLLEPLEGRAAEGLGVERRVGQAQRGRDARDLAGVQLVLEAPRRLAGGVPGGYCS
jgi:hypothetical protein